MEKQEFERALQDQYQTISQIKELAHKVHEAVNQHYDKVLPYAVHLDSVADYVARYGHSVCQSPDDVVPLMFGAYFHDSIEDARLTYNNVKHTALRFMPEPQAHMATEIVYALTNEKGRTRAERANDRYYLGIRRTPYAPLCKFADRMANVSYSAGNGSTKRDQSGQTMLHVYAQENKHFMTAIIGGDTPSDQRLRVPRDMVNDLVALFG